MNKVFSIAASTWAVIDSVRPFTDTLQNAWGRFILNGFHLQIMKLQFYQTYFKPLYESTP